MVSKSLCALGMTLILTQAVLAQEQALLFSATDLNSGEQIRLEDYRGKVVFVDFWASWCPPCRRENPNLVKVYKKYHDKGFEIYQVSLDKTRDAWLLGISEDELHWIHVSDLKFWNSIVVPVYNIQGIPMSYLLDRRGRIIAQNLRGDMLEQELKQIFNP